MASLSPDGKKRWRIQFFDPSTGKRRQLRVSQTTKKNAHIILAHIEAILAAIATGSAIPMAQAHWLKELPADFHKRLVRAGIAAPRSSPRARIVSLKGLCDAYIVAGRTVSGRPASQATIKKWKTTRRLLLECFPGMDANEMTTEDGYQFREWLGRRRIKNDEPMMENAIRKHIDVAKVFLKNAVTRGMLDVNPFAHIPSSTLINRERDFYVNQDTAFSLLRAASTAEWRVLIRLWRFAGLRKMEPSHLQWEDVLWDHGKLRVTATKTAHIEGGDIRYVPLRDIRDALWDLHQEAEIGETRIITHFSESNTNLDKPMKKILHRAGIVPWPKLFQNMRASCETDWLTEGHPAHVVAGWIGHTVRVQRQSYAQITEGHFDAFNSLGPLKPKSSQSEPHSEPSRSGSA